MNAVIIPPPDIREVIENTSAVVRDGGKEAEVRILGSERNNPKYSFMNQNDPYHPFYVKCLDGSSAKLVSSSGATEHSVSNLRKAFFDIDSHFLHTIPCQLISAFDLDLIKLTSLYASVNDSSFISNLVSRELCNSQFDFLKIDHSQSILYKRYLSSYERTFLPAESPTGPPANSFHSLLDTVRALSYQVEDLQRDHGSPDSHLDQSSLDWNNFLIGDVVDFKEYDQYEVPMFKTGLLSASVSQKQAIYGLQLSNEKVALPRLDEGKQYVICPICKGSIKSQDFEKHLKLETVSKASAAQNASNQAKYGDIQHENSSDTVKRNISAMLGYGHDEITKKAK